MKKSKTVIATQDERIANLSELELAKALIATPEAQAMLGQSGARKFDDLIGQHGLVAQMLKPLMQELLEAEMTEHLGYAKHDPSGYLTGNSRNGSYRRTLRSSGGQLALDTPGIVRATLPQQWLRHTNKYRLSWNKRSLPCMPMVPAPKILPNSY